LPFTIYLNLNLNTGVSKNLILNSKPVFHLGSFTIRRSVLAVVVLALLVLLLLHGGLLLSCWFGRLLLGLGWLSWLGLGRSRLLDRLHGLHLWLSWLLRGSLVRLAGKFGLHSLLGGRRDLVNWGGLLA